MDHLSADLLCKNLPGDGEGIRVINVHISLKDNRETKHRAIYMLHQCVPK